MTSFHFTVDRAHAVTNELLKRNQYGIVRSMSLSHMPDKDVMYEVLDKDVPVMEQICDETK